MNRFSLVWNSINATFYHSRKLHYGRTWCNTGPKFKCHPIKIQILLCSAILSCVLFGIDLHIELECWKTFKICKLYMDISMTSLLTHIVAHSTRPSFRLKTNNQPPKKFLSLAVSWVKAVKNGKILTFKVNFLCQKSSKSF